MVLNVLSQEEPALSLGTIPLTLTVVASFSPYALRFSSRVADHTFVSETVGFTISGNNCQRGANVLVSVKEAQEVRNKGEPCH